MKYLLQIAVSLSVPTLCMPSRAADATNGKRLAEQWCASCHLVSASQTRARADVPTFQEIAGRPGFNAARLAFFLLDPHPKMPNMSLTRNEAADLAAYIESLNAPH
jgi:mono/diheme cytochrome c family protein